MYDLIIFENYNYTSNSSGFHSKISYAIEIDKIIVSIHHQISHETMREGFFTDSYLVSLLIFCQNIKFLLAKLAGHIRIDEVLSNDEDTLVLPSHTNYLWN